MKIVFFVGSMNAGGAERVAATLANAWAERGEEVVLVPTHLASASSFYPIDEQVRVRWLHTVLPALPWPKPLRKWLAIRQMVRKEQPDVVVSFLTNVNVMVLIALRGIEIPIVVCERTNPMYSKSAGRVLRWLRSKTYGWAAKVALQTEDSAKGFALQEPSLGPLAVLANPLPGQLLQVERTVSVEHETEPRVVAMGRLVPAKGFSELISAFAEVALTRLQWQLYIYGEGPLRAELEKKAELVGLKDRIHLVGRTEEPWRELNQAQLFVLSSHYEGFPNALLEAMALGLACVAVDCPSGPAEITQQGRDAKLIPPRDPVAMTNALAELMDDARLRGAMGQRAALSVRSRYAVPAVLAQWDHVFKEVGVESSSPLQEP
ncbi:glycosyltransferase family 4 protein [Paenalcaligenes niemegkensis]|uniref:glycosyltransferase family 4 protein n=1 Tax=Paenalcaligenes niemegkensis TaxID=2895469 RepID=UPI001EE7E80E|nr:glycosyltransferase family 4 protein [Paenalcaligenes niemegkensis]MCQ9617243.1 glycosyltransferase family 4 protein [Paenalcaligenes niemegkensis]